MQSRFKEGNIYSVLSLVLLSLTILLIAFMIYLLYPSFFPFSPDFAEKTREGLQEATSGIEESLNEIKGEKIQELTPEQLPIGVNPERSLYILEKETFRLMNQERTSRSLVELRWDERVANTAFKHAKEMGLNDYINHTNLQGINADGRLAANRIFNVCSSENIFFIESRNSKENLTERAVQGWLESTGHRKNLLDPKITRGGVGIYCEDRKCYVNANHICTTTEITEDLRDRYVYFFSLYPEDIEFDTALKINFHIEVTEQADIFVVPNNDQHRKYVNREDFQFTKEYDNILEITDTTAIERGYGFIVVPSGDSELIIKIEYL